MTALYRVFEHDDPSRSGRNLEAPNWRAAAVEYAEQEASEFPETVDAWILGGKALTVTNGAQTWRCHVNAEVVFSAWVAKEVP